MDARQVDIHGADRADAIEAELAAAAVGQSLDRLEIVQNAG